MTQTSNRFFDEFAKMMTDAAGVAQGAKAEMETMFRSQGERLLRSLDVPQREEFEAVKAMAEKARFDCEKLQEKVAALEAALVAAGHPLPGSPQKAE